MPSQKPMSVAEAGRLGIKSSIKKYGVNGHRKRCSDAGKARMHKMTQKERSRVALRAVAARVFYSMCGKNGRELWASMTEEEKEEWTKEFSSLVKKKKSRRKEYIKERWEEYCRSRKKK